MIEVTIGQIFRIAHARKGQRRGNALPEARKPIVEGDFIRKNNASAQDGFRKLEKCIHDRACRACEQLNRDRTLGEIARIEYSKATP
jgi:hypothetical protein